jgi:hypothetical protein
VFSKGADVDALRASAGRLASFGNELDVVRARGRRAVSTLQGVWQGPDLQHLVERWRRVEHDLARISADFDRLSLRLHDNADLQHRSSGATSQAAGHGGGHVAAHAPAQAPRHAPAQAPAHVPGHVSGHVSGHAPGPPAGHASGAHVGAGPAAPQGAPSVTSWATPQAHAAMGWAQWIGVGPSGAHLVLPGGPVHPVPSAVGAAAAAHHLGLPVR